jgi:hypothetical protein
VIYTCYDMVQDCRAGRSEGWSFFVTQYVPVIQKLVAHYASGRKGDQATVEQVLTALSDPHSGIFCSVEPGPERTFLAELRQWLLAWLESSDTQPAPDLEVDLETLSAALKGFTLVERQAVWLETMRYEASDAGVMLRMDAHTVEKIRSRAAECLRTSIDNWRRSMLGENGSGLRRAAAAARSPECFPAKAFLDMIDGRTVWRGREEIERHGTACWYCVDHFCRLLEVVELLRDLQPLTEQQSESFQAALGLLRPRKSGWKRWFGQGGV